MGNFKKNPIDYQPQIGCMSAVLEHYSVSDGRDCYHHLRESMPVAYPRDNEMPVTNFTLEAQLKSGVPLEKLNPVIFSDAETAGEFLGAMADAEEQQQQQQQDIID
ncbi:MAG: hypothetical protein J5965_15565 [Aeriscardovia sp.]|nr:hypothetical protein [Aeriscardovia sp.]